MDIRVDATQAFLLAQQFDQAHSQTVTDTRKVVADAAKDLRQQWASRARATAGSHGKHYPNSITQQMLSWNTAEVGPETGRKQGGMGRGFEYGSRNQPPHLDGTQAADRVEPAFARALDDMVTRILGGGGV